MARKRRKKKVREPFWKKLDPELKHIGAHVGKIFDNAKPGDIIDLLAAFTAAYGGFNAAKNVGADLPASLGAAGSGILAYQLAKSGNIVAGASGVAYLAALGLLNVLPWIPEVKLPPPATFPIMPPEYWPPVWGPFSP